VDRRGLLLLDFEPAAGKTGQEKLEHTTVPEVVDLGGPAHPDWIAEPLHGRKATGASRPVLEESGRARAAGEGAGREP
jgi:hypothetical protein